MGGVSARADNIASDKHEQAMMNAEGEGLQDMFGQLGEITAQEQIASDMAGTGAQGKPSYDAAGNLIIRPEGNQMFNLPSFWNQDLNNVNWPAGLGVA